MDELTMVKELRASAAPMPDAVEDSVRLRLRMMANETDEARPKPRSSRRRQTIVRLSLAGALATTVATGITVAQTVGGPSATLGVANAAELGDRAAKAVQDDPYTPPRPKQWVYGRFVTASGFDMNRPWEGVDLNGRETVERWERVDGKAGADIHNGKLQVTSYPSKTDPRHFHLGNYHTLPTDPDALLRKLYADRYPNQIGETGPGDVFLTLSGMLQEPLPPRLRAAIYRALPKIPGVELRRDVLDAAGRKGVAFSRVEDMGDRQSIVLDPATYRYLGTRHEVARERTEKTPEGATVTYRKGLVLGWYAYLDLKIVDRAGLRS